MPLLQISFKILEDTFSLDGHNLALGEVLGVESVAIFVVIAWTLIATWACVRCYLVQDCKASGLMASERVAQRFAVMATRAFGLLRVQGASSNLGA